MTALELCYTSAGLFFTGALLTGIWKYLGIVKSDDAKAPEYVSVLHRAGLMYSFATMLLAEFTKLSRLSDRIEFYASLAVILFFAFAQFTYLVHAILRDTDNQFKKPYRLWKWKVPPVMIHGSMVFLILGETGGFLVLFWGYLITL